MIVDPGQLEMGSAVMNRLGDLGQHLDDPAADAQFEALLTIPALRAFLAPRMATHGLTSVREYLRDLLRYTSQDTAPAITCPSYVTEHGLGRPGKGAVRPAPGSAEGSGGGSLAPVFEARPLARGLHRSGRG